MKIYMKIDMKINKIKPRYQEKYLFFWNFFCILLYSFFKKHLFFFFLQLFHFSPNKETEFFLIHISVQPDGVKLWCFKLELFDLTEFIYQYTLFVCLSVYPFVSNEHQNGWTDPAQILCGTLHDPRESLWMLKITKICAQKFLIF